MQTRRLVAVGVIVVVVVLMAVLIHGCEVSETNSSLKNYAANVADLMTASNGNGATMFKELKSGEAASNIENLQEQLNQALDAARSQLNRAQGLSVPSQMSSAQQNLIETMQLRLDGIQEIAGHVQDAMSTDTSVSGVYAIAQGAYTLAASDVVYKVSVGPAIASALNAASIAVGGISGVPINSGQIVNDLGWLQTTNIAVWIGAKVPSSLVNTAAPGLHGHMLNFVTVDGQQLSTQLTNTIAANPAPTFTLNITNGGNFDEYQVGCKAWVKGLNDIGISMIPETRPGQTYNCQVTLPSAPKAGTYTVEAEVVPVPGEKNIANNFLYFPVTFS